MQPVTGIETGSGDPGPGVPESGGSGPDAVPVLVYIRGRGGGKKIEIETQYEVETCKLGNILTSNWDDEIGQ